MSYSDRVNSNSSRPACWGERDQYDPDDSECQDCRYFHSCRGEVERSGNRRRSRPSSSSSSSSSRRERRPASRDVEDVKYERGEVKEGETAFARFGKDALGGALRGSFYEMYEFWRRYRIP